MKTIAVW